MGGGRLAVSRLGSSKPQRTTLLAEFLSEVLEQDVGTTMVALRGEVHPVGEQRFLVLDEFREVDEVDRQLTSDLTDDGVGPLDGLLLRGVADVGSSRASEKPPRG